MTDAAEGRSLVSGKTIGQIGLDLEPIGWRWEVVKLGPARISAHPLVVMRQQVQQHVHSVPVSEFRSLNPFVNWSPGATCGSRSSRVPRTVAPLFGKLGVYILLVEP
jgi:hypothetical protein